MDRERPVTLGMDWRRTLGQPLPIEAALMPPPVLARRPRQGLLELSGYNAHVGNRANRVASQLEAAHTPADPSTGFQSFPRVTPIFRVQRDAETPFDSITNTQSRRLIRPTSPYRSHPQRSATHLLHCRFGFVRRYPDPARRTRRPPS